jgi:hypothetical protein
MLITGHHRGTEIGLGTLTDVGSIRVCSPLASGDLRESYNHTKDEAGIERNHRSRLLEWDLSRSAQPLHVTLDKPNCPVKRERIPDQPSGYDGLFFNFMRRVE